VELGQGEPQVGPVRVSAHAGLEEPDRLGGLACRGQQTRVVEQALGRLGLRGDLAQGRESGGAVATAEGLGAGEYEGAAGPCASGPEFRSSSFVEPV
jgi:hypothetical protein